MNSGHCTQEMGWYWIHCRIPGEWECVRYKNEAREGELEFHTREGLQAVLRWKQLPREPDGLRILNAFHKDHLEQNNDEALLRFSQLASRQEGDWVCAWDLPGSPFHACRYNAEGKMFLHWIFTSFSELARDTWASEMLHSSDGNNGDIRRWRLLGLRADLPRVWKPVEINAIPANVAIVFEGPKKAHITVRRWGIPHVQLMEHDLYSFYGSLQKSLSRKLYGRADTSVHGLPALRLEIDERGWFGFEKMVGKWWSGDATIWHDEAKKRLYAVERIGPRKATLPEVSDVWSPAPE